MRTCLSFFTHPKISLKICLLSKKKFFHRSIFLSEKINQILTQNIDLCKDTTHLNIVEIPIEALLTNNQKLWKIYKITKAKLEIARITNFSKSIDDSSHLTDDWTFRPTLNYNR